MTVKEYKTDSEIQENIIDYFLGVKKISELNNEEEKYASEYKLK